jgi:hypothetical protein
MVWIDTFNYFVEGSAIAQTDADSPSTTDLSITQTKSAAYKAATYANATQVSTTLASSNTNSGLMQDEVPKAATTANSGGGRRATDTSMFFSVDDSFIRGPSLGADVTVTIEYLDNGQKTIALYYDSTSGDKHAGDIAVHATNGFLTQSFRLSDAYFGNRFTYANDIRLQTDVTNAMVIKSITVKSNTTYPIPTLAAGWARTFLPAGQRNLAGW